MTLGQASPSDRIVLAIWRTFREHHTTMPADVGTAAYVALVVVLNGVPVQTGLSRYDPTEMRTT
jgi:hypothetical protein